MLLRLTMKLVEWSPSFRRFLWRRWYQHLAGYERRDWRFMNYGYESLDPAATPLVLQPDDEPNRFSIQLYHHVASAVPLAGLEMVEVGSGRGGGASYVARYLRPKSLTGIDVSEKAVRLCNQVHQVPGLTFRQGDAEHLPLAGASCDAVLNVESSHCYGSMAAFLGEVRRILRPRGYFLFADLRFARDQEKLDGQIAASGLSVVSREDITANVVEALRKDSERKLALIQQGVPARWLETFKQFAAIEGTNIFASFRDGTMVYVRYLLQSPA